MTNITAGMVKDLRDKTGAGMMDCKSALAEANGDIEAAVDTLRKKGLAKAAKKAGRIAADGLIGIAVEGGRGAIVEVNSETDFVAKGEEFQTFVRHAAEHGLHAEGVLEKLLARTHSTGSSVAEVLSALVGKVGENMSVRRSAWLSVSPGVVATYMHNKVSPDVNDLGKLGVLVALESSADPVKLAALGKQLAMHAANTNPIALTADQVSADTIARERAIFADQARESGKSENIIEKMVDGRMRKFFEEQVFLQQGFIFDPEKPVSKVLEDAGKEFGAPVKIAGFLRFQVGEGIDKPVTDFAAEVKSLT